MSGAMLTVGVLLQLKDMLTPGINQVEARLKGLARLSDGLVKAGAALSAVGLATSGISAKARGVVSETFAAAAEIDALTQKLRTIPDITEDQVQRAIAAARKWAASYGQSAGEYVDSFYETAGALGVDQFNASLSATENAMRVARGSFGQTGDAAKTLTQLFSNYGGSIEAVADKLVHTQNAFQISHLAQLTSGLQSSAAQALAFRVELDQVLAVLGALNNKGLTNERAGTALAAALRELPEASKKLQFDLGKNAQGGVDFVATLANITARYGDLNRLTNEQRIAFQKAFGDEGLRAVQLLSGEIGALRDKQKAMAGADAANVSAKAFETVTQGANVQMQVLDQQIADLKAEIGQDFLPILKDLMPVIRDVLKSIAEFVKQNPDFSKWALGLAALASPVASLAGGVAVLGGGALKLADHFHLFEKLGSLNFASLSGVGAALTTFGANAAKALKGAGLAISAVMKAHPVLAAILLAGAVAVAVYTYWDDLAAAANKAMTAVAQAFANAGKAIGKTVRDWARLGGDLVDGLIAGIKDRLVKLMERAGSLAKSVLAELRDAFDTHSPSRETWKIGEDVADGLIGGLLARAQARDAEIAALAASIGETLGQPLSAVSEVVPVAPAGARRNASGQFLAHGDLAVLDALQVKYGAVAAAAKSYFDSAGEYADNLRNAFTRAFKGMEDALTGFVMTGKLDFKSLANSIIADLIRIQIQERVTKSFASGLAAFFGGARSAAPIVDKSVPVARAAGGLVTGPGAATSDSIPAWLSNGEFVMRASAVRHFGVAAMERINRYADGGMVGRAPAALLGGGVQVNVINNAAGAQATARERTDGGGNRIVDVIVEQVKGAIAGDIVRGAGPIPGALSSTYGLNRVAGAY